MAAVTVYSAPDDGRKGRPKHVEHNSIVNKHNTARVALLVYYIQGGSNMTGTDLYVNKPQCAAVVRP